MNHIKTFGFEIEGEYTEDTMQHLERAHHAIQTSDGSIDSCCSHLSKAEMVSKVYAFHELKDAQKLFNSLQARCDVDEYHYNDSCGFHIHVSTGAYPAELFWFRFAQQFQQQVKATFPEMWERRKNNTYCQPIKSNKTFNRDSRYFAINQQAYGRHKTAEIRLFGANEPWLMYEYLVFTLDNINVFLRNPHHHRVSKKTTIADTPASYRTQDNLTKKHVVALGGHAPALSISPVSLLG
jgi:hypothetical protein